MTHPLLDIQGLTKHTKRYCVTITDLYCAYLLTYLCPRSAWDLPIF
jgi:hypothetical protein